MLEKINRILQIRLVQSLTTKILLEEGLSQHDIKKLIDNNIIKRVQRGEYELVSIEELYKYGISLLANKEYSKANLCFEKCYEIDPTNRTSLKCLFYVSIKKRNFEMAYQILEQLKDTKSEEEQKENNLYLYLLNYSKSAPSEEIKDKVHSTTKEDLLYESANKEKINEAILAIMAKRPSYAISKINDFEKKNEMNKMHNAIIREFLIYAIEIDREVSEQIIKLTTQERYFDIKLLLIEKSKTRNYKKTEACCLTIVEKIMQMLQTGQVLEVNTLYTQDIFYAIKGNNFELAKKLQDEHNRKYNITKETPLDNLLIKIISLIESMKNKSESLLDVPHSETSETIEDHQEETLPKYKEPILEEKITEQIISIPDLIIELLQNNIEKFNELLRLYLKQINKKESEYLIMQLVKLSTIEKDNSYLKIITILKSLENNTYIFDITEYIQIFYTYLSQDKLTESRIILDIIKKYYTDSPVIIDNLNSSLNQKEETLSKETIVPTFTKEETELIQPTIDPMVLECREMLNRTLYEMNQLGETLTILEDIPYQKRAIIHTLVKEIEGLKIFSVGKEPKTMVLRITKKHERDILYSEVIDEFYLANSEKRYGRCLEIINILLQDDNFNPLEQDKPKIFFDAIAHIHLMLTNHKEAIKYLKIVTSMNRKDVNREKRYDYRELICTISNLSPSTNAASINESRDKNVRSEVIEKFQLNKLEKIENEISGNFISLKEAVDKYNLTEEEIILIKLIRARNCYIDRMPEMGDRIIREVEHTKNKSLLVIYFLDEIKMNKKLYSNRFRRYARQRKK